MEREHIVSTNYSPSSVINACLLFFSENEDYTGVNETLIFRPDLMPVMCVDLVISEDNLVEDNETFVLEITSDDPAILLVDPTTAQITIINTDGKNYTYFGMIISIRSM